ncbi:MAG: NifB/NifX family molybdenum-iron cluster-binding protein [Proteobacteria bacterium]|nr:NifB/NifX family molybdenum-iron cluster-binding protein [Pseudomonadota bacterium]
MKIAITANTTELTSLVDARFGRCAYFLIVDLDDMQVTAVPNRAQEQNDGAGIQAARIVMENGATAVLTGHCGPNAHRTLSAAGIAVYTGITGIAAEAMAQFRDGKLSASTGPNAPSHAGMPPATS